MDESMNRPTEMTLTDQRIEDALKAGYGRLEHGDRWAIEDADLHPFVRLLRTRYAGTTQPPAMTDQQIEDAFIASGGSWDVDYWVIERAGLQPFVRSLQTLDASTAQPPAGPRD